MTKTFKNINDLKKAYNTTFITVDEELARIKNHPTGDFHYYWFNGKTWEYKMSSLEPYFFKPEDYK